MRTRAGGHPVNLNDIQNTCQFYALVSVYSRPDQDMLEESYGVLWACQYEGNQQLIVIPVKTILSVVSIQPLPKQNDREDGLWFVLEKSGVEEVEIMEFGDPDDNDDDPG
jgi:hypothetical protein